MTAPKEYPVKIRKIPVLDKKTGITGSPGSPILKSADALRPGPQV